MFSKKNISQEYIKIYVKDDIILNSKNKIFVIYRKFKN